MMESNSSPFGARENLRLFQTGGGRREEGQSQEQGRGNRKYKVAFLAEASTFGYGVCNPWTTREEMSPERSRAAHQEVLPRCADAAIFRPPSPIFATASTQQRAQPADQSRSRREGRVGRTNTWRSMSARTMAVNFPRTGNRRSRPRASNSRSITCSTSWSNRAEDGDCRCDRCA